MPSRKLEGIERDYAQLTGESSILFQQIAADSSRRLSRTFGPPDVGLVLLTAVLNLEALRPVLGHFAMQWPWFASLAKLCGV